MITQSVVERGGYQLSSSENGGGGLNRRFTVLISAVAITTRTDRKKNGKHQKIFMKTKISKRITFSGAPAFFQLSSVEQQRRMIKFNYNFHFHKMRLLALFGFLQT